MPKKSSDDQATTKKDLKKLATRTELKTVEKNLRVEILRVEKKVENLEENISAQMRQQHDQVMTAVSNFAGRVEELETENEIGSDQISRLEKRVATLESTA